MASIRHHSRPKALVPCVLISPGPPLRTTAGSVPMKTTTSQMMTMMTTSRFRGCPVSTSLHPGSTSMAREARFRTGHPEPLVRRLSWTRAQRRLSRRRHPAACCRNCSCAGRRCLRGRPTRESSRRPPIQRIPQFRPSWSPHHWARRRAMGRPSHRPRQSSLISDIVARRAQDRSRR